jgi:hypothetical protein
MSATITSTIIAPRSPYRSTEPAATDCLFLICLDFTALPLSILGTGVFSHPEIHLYKTSKNRSEAAMAPIWATNVYIGIF